MRQAVVVIHGIGEQRPMDTVRGFVNAVMPQPDNPKKPKFWSKPDPLSELFELRKLTTPQSRRVPPTDFFEYYWAYQTEGTKFVHVLSWARALLLRRPSRVPQHLRVLWFTLWLLIIATLTFMTTNYWGQLVGIGERMTKASYLLGALSSLLLLVISGFILNYIGDAARYLHPSPTNIDMRRRIRAEGVALLTRLHECRQYDRIILVGHSLGSVIAYDVLRHLWPVYNTGHTRLLEVHQPVIHQIDDVRQTLQPDPSTETTQAFRDVQVALWEEQRRLGNPWLVTDLITLGSPLAHAVLLLAKTPNELVERQRERELPTCPPVPDEGTYSYRLTYDVETTKRTIFALHHAALFACTRWTNLYFPARLGFWGDFVGGPLHAIFGSGIRDVAVSSDEWNRWLQHTPFIHTHYWNTKTAASTEFTKSSTAAIDVLRTALELESRRLLREVDAGERQPV